MVGLEWFSTAHTHIYTHTRAHTQQAQKRREKNKQTKSTLSSHTNPSSLNVRTLSPPHQIQRTRNIRRIIHTITLQYCLGVRRDGQESHTRSLAEAQYGICLQRLFSIRTFVTEFKMDESTHKGALQTRYVQSLQADAPISSWQSGNRFSWR